MFSPAAFGGPFWKSLLLIAFVWVAKVKWELSFPLRALVLRITCLSLGTFGLSVSRLRRHRLARTQLKALAAVARLYVPVVQCPSCNYPNDNEFKLCQMCGFCHPLVSNNNSLFAPSGYYRPARQSTLPLAVDELVYGLLQTEGLTLRTVGPVLSPLFLPTKTRVMPHQKMLADF
jgi:hypothetical protein